MVNYENGKIYKIVCDSTGKVYIGSTCTMLCQRLAQHVNLYKCNISNECITKHGCASFEIIKNNNYKIILLENYSCNNKEELMKKEREYFDKLECVNRYRPAVPYAEKLQLAKKYKDTHKNEIKIWEQTVHREKRNEITKKYHKVHFEQIKARETKNIICDYCKCQFQFRNRSRHEKTAKHQSALLAIKS
jgi:hypothetical protein